MSKFTFQILAALSLLVLVLAACAPAGGEATPGTDITESVPGTGPDATATVITGSGADSDTGTNNAECEGVDTTQLVNDGQAVYTAQCADCHGEQGEGQGSFPPLAGDANLTGADIPGIVQSYLAVDAHPKDLSGEDLAAVLSYSRSTFNNNAAVICPAQIQELLPATQ